MRDARRTIEGRGGPCDRRVEEPVLQSLRLPLRMSRSPLPSSFDEKTALIRAVLVQAVRRFRLPIDGACEHDPVRAADTKAWLQKA
jgi:hypothetical protein